MRTVKHLVSFVALAAACLYPARASAQSITVARDHFQVQWPGDTGPKAKFLLFISYFDAMRATDLDGDLAYIKGPLGLDGIRIFPNWLHRTADYCEDTTNTDDLLFDRYGNVRGDAAQPTGRLQRLITILDAARFKKLVVDVSFTMVPDMTVEDYKKAVTRTATLLRDYDNVIFDLSNEADKNGPDQASLKQLRNDIVANPDSAVGDSSRIVVVSRGGDPNATRDYNEDIGTAAIAYHDGRGTGWETQVANSVGGLRPSGKPVYLQEPMPWSSGLSICVDKPGGGVEPGTKEADGDPSHFRTAVDRARFSGAAAWTFHTRQGFRLDAGGTFASRIFGNTTERDMLQGTASDKSLSKIAEEGMSGTLTWGINPPVVVVSVNGPGAVTSVPGGINCPSSNCSFTFPAATTVTLTAHANAGSAFTGWSGGVCSGTSTCQVTASSNITATFVATGPHLGFSIDAPTGTAAVSSPFLVGGWASDTNNMPGVSSVKVYAASASGGTIELATAQYGDSREDLPCSCVFNAFVSLPKGEFDLYLVVSFTAGGSAESSPRRHVTVIPPSSNDVRRAGDVDGDLKSEITVYNTSSGVWSSLTSASGYLSGTTHSWGGSGYVPTPGDYDGDGKADLGTYVQSTGVWYVLLSGANFTTSLSRSVGGAGWAPVQGDYDGDGLTDFVVYNTTTGQWYGLKSSSNYTTTVNVFYGGSGYTPVTGDFDGDGKTDLGVYQIVSGSWSILRASSGFTTSLSASNGGTGWDPVPADFDGDGKTDFATYNTSTGQWYALKSGSAGSISVGWGGSGYTPVKGDYDGDGKADLATYVQSSGTWYILLSGSGYTTSLSKNLGGAGWTALPRYPQ